MSKVACAVGLWLALAGCTPSGGDPRGLPGPGSERPDRGGAPAAGSGGAAGAPAPAPHPGSGGASVPIDDPSDEPVLRDAGASGGAAGTGDATAPAPALDAAGAPPATSSACPAGRNLVFHLDFTDPNWNGGADGVEAALRGLGTASMAGPANVSVMPDPEHGNALKVVYPKGSGSNACVQAKACPGTGGIAFRAPLPEGNAITSAVLSYWVKFDPGFEWVKGGKLPGLCGGECATGGLEVLPDRFSIRYMWRGGNSGEVYAYLSNPPNPGYGLDMGLGSWHWQNDGKWHQISEELILNTGNNNDGVIRVWYDRPLTGPPNFEQKNLKYYDRTKYPNLGIDKLIFSTFHGGHDASWAPKKDVVAFFADVQVCR